MTEPVKHLPYGSVRLDASMADDLSVVNSARVSFGKHRNEIDDADEGLIKFLMKNRHGTPFEHNAFRFHIKCPIFVAREWFRHRIGSFNEYSGRYTEMPREVYLPNSDDIRTQVGKPGAYTFKPVKPDVARMVRSSLTGTYKVAFDTYDYLLESGVAKEVARDVLPVATYTEFYWTVNARSLMNFLSLRTAPTALLEIRQYAADVEKIFAETMPITYKAWIAADKVAP